MLYAQLVYFNGLFDTKKDTNDPHLGKENPPPFPFHV